MNFKEYMLYSSIVAMGLFIFTLLAYLALQISTSEGFNKLFIREKKKTEDIDLDNDEWEDL